MLQPFIVNEDTIEMCDRYLVGYASIEKALRDGIEAARAHDGKVKIVRGRPKDLGSMIADIGARS